MRLEEVSCVRRGRRVLDRVSLSVHAGELAVVMGARGAGKSTLLALAAAALRPSAGAIYLGGRNVHRLQSRSLPYVRRNIGYLAADPAVAAQTATQFVEEDQVSAFVGYDDSDSVIATAPTFQAAGIPYITVGATSPKLPSQLGDMVFLAAFGDNVQAAAGAEYALAEFGDTAYLLWDKGTEYTTLLGKAGFRLNRVVPTTSVVSIVEGVPV